MRAIAAKAAKDAIESFAKSELSAHLGYEKGGRRASGASDARNGTYERTVQTSFGPITVSVPRDRDGDFRTAALPRYKRKTEVISSAILKLYSSGMTDEEMRVVIESLYDADVSKSYVSSVTDAVLADVEEFKKRPLPPRFFCLYLDSTYLPLRRDSVQKEAVNIAMGIDGAVDASFPKAKRQRCFLHLMRNLCSKVRPSERKEAASDFMSLAKRASKEEAERAFAEFKGKWGAKYKSVAKWADSLRDFLTFYEFPEALRRKIYTNNAIEGFNKQIKRMCKKSIQFVTEDALEKKLVTMFLHFNDGMNRRKVRGWAEIVEFMEKGA